MAAGSSEVGEAIQQIAGISQAMNAQVGEASTSAHSVSLMAQSRQALPRRFQLDTRPNLQIIRPTSSGKGRDGEK